MKQVQKKFKVAQISIVFCISVILCLPDVNSQTSVFQDAKGESAFKVFGSAITLNAKDQNISFSSDFFKRDNSSHTQFNRLGLFAKVTANEGIANLKNENGFLIDGETGIYYGKRNTSMPGNSAGWANEKYVSANLLIDRNKFFNADPSAEKLTFSQGNAGWKLEIGWFGYVSDWLWGVSSNIKKQTNIDNLKQNNLSSSLGTINTVNILQQTSAYNIKDFRSNLKAFNFNADGALLLNRSAITTPGSGIGALLLGLHLRYKAIEDAKPVFNPAMGLYISRVGAPQDVVAGLNFQLQDAFNVNQEESNLWKRFGINLTAGFRIN